MVISSLSTAKYIRECLLFILKDPMVYLSEVHNLSALKLFSQDHVYVNRDRDSMLSVSFHSAIGNNYEKWKHCWK